MAKKRKFEDELEEGLQISKKKKLDEGVQFSDLIDKPLGSVPSIMFWNDQQIDFINNIRDMNHTLLIGDYGTGQIRTSKTDIKRTFSLRQDLAPGGSCPDTGTVG